MSKSKLYFYYGAMGSSKTAQALMVRFNYQEKGRNALMVKPRTDTRDGEHIIHSRIGLSYQCKYIDEVRELPDSKIIEYDVLIVDEAQFLTKDEVYWLVHVVDELNIPVMCYGLMSDFQGNLFQGSEQLVILADKLQEIKTICWCGRKACFNARINSKGEVIKQGEQILIGANDKYVSLCRKHWMEGNIGNKVKVE